MTRKIHCYLNNLGVNYVRPDMRVIVNYRWFILYKKKVTLRKFALPRLASHVINNKRFYLIIFALINKVRNIVFLSSWLYRCMHYQYTRHAIISNYGWMKGVWLFDILTFATSSAFNLCDRLCVSFIERYYLDYLLNSKSIY